MGNYEQENQMLTVLEDLGMQYRGNYTKRKFRAWKVQCSECGKIFIKYQSTTNTSGCQECGNKRAGKKREKHGMWKHRLMSIYLSCKQRCYNPNHRQYKNWGGNGVTICQEWLDSFESFAQWALSNGYEDHLELDKDELCEQLGISPKVYSPQTCRWVPKSINAISNLRQDHRTRLSYNDVIQILMDYQNKVFTARELAKQYNVDVTTIYYNLKHFRLENNELQRI